ncbi:purine-cytosine permease family protein [Spelaeicoccus albus]|uniref:NCS1 family nucleobase:cation symporter-1 n=1 Tax=Spelaeicoccus albus TaxID=1280376 RepID=A0A7Z0IJ26_9MICO|nr:cytosine permease [Spelaeicoccus albus]NYI69110.1 NCS1 family nucleobase:cation symporter-1 [Spelaeicoccus albus]
MSQKTAPDAPADKPGFLVESHSIGYVPRSERYGRPLNQFTLWFGSNLNITCIVTGALAVVLGGDVIWSIIGLLIGQILGGAVMSLHSVQGPRLGLPQMISSRAQFGVYGAVIPLVLVILMYIGFAASGTVLAGQAVAGLIHSPHWTGIIIFGIVTAVIAIIGYRLIHVMGRLASLISGLAFVYLTIRLLTGTDLGALFGDNHFTVSSFVLAMSLSASWQIAYGPYVADYSRYLPASTKQGTTFWSTFAGAVIGSQWSMTFGVLAAAIAGDKFAGDEVGFVVSLGGTGIVAAALYFVIALGKLCVNVLNAYGGFMSTITTITGFAGHREITKSARAVVVSAIMVIAMVIALAGSTNFVDKFSTFLLFLLTFFTPWSAVNLVDFYFLSKERYDVPAIGDPNGRYGKWNVAAIASYVIGLAAQMPFLYTSFYTGPFVKALGNTDYSWIIGLIVPAIVYFILSKIIKRSIPTRLILPDDAEGEKVE